MMDPKRGRGGSLGIAEEVGDVMSKSEKESVESILKKGNELINEGKAGEAITLFDGAIEKHPSDPSLYVARGNAYFCEQNWRFACRDYTIAVKMKPDSPEARSWRRRSCRRRLRR